MEYKIGSFNVRNLNETGSQKVDDRTIIRSFETIANIIRKEELAVVALQEVLSRTAVENIKNILNRLGGKWKEEWDQPPPKKAGAKADPRGEGYAYLWDTTKLDLVPVKKNDEMRIFMPNIWHQYRRNGQPLIREPYYARFAPVGKIGGCFCEIRLINTHIVYGNTNTDGIEMREKEFLKVVKNVYQNIANKRYGNNLPAYVIVLGDYNLSLEQLNTLEKKEDTIIQIGNSPSQRKEEKVITRQGEKTTVSHKKQDNGTYKSDFVSNYDHFSFIERYEDIMNITIERIDPQKYCKDLVEYWETVSDHIPIKMTIDLNKRSTNKLHWNK